MSNNLKLFGSRTSKGSR